MFKKAEILLREKKRKSVFKRMPKIKKHEHTRATIRSNPTQNDFSKFECETEVPKTKVSDHHGVHLNVSVLNNNQNNTKGEDKQKNREF